MTDFRTPLARATSSALSTAGRLPAIFVWIFELCEVALEIKRNADNIYVMSQGLHLSQRMSLSQVPAPQLQQSLALLQAPTLELKALVEQEKQTGTPSAKVVPPERIFQDLLGGCHAAARQDRR